MSNHRFFCWSPKSPLEVPDVRTFRGPSWDVPGTSRTGWVISKFIPWNNSKKSLILVSSFCSRSIALNFFFYIKDFFKEFLLTDRNFSILDTLLLIQFGTDDQTPGNFRKLFMKNIGCIKQPRTLYVCMLQDIFTSSSVGKWRVGMVLMANMMGGNLPCWILLGWGLY